MVFCTVFGSTEFCFKCEWANMLWFLMRSWTEIKKGFTSNDNRE